MSLETYIAAMPKVELHVHLEGAIQPETLLELAERHDMPLPAANAQGLREWYRFTGFPHFVEVYVATTARVRTVDDIELIACRFLAGQAAQNIWYTEATFTAFTHMAMNKIAFRDSLAALNRAADWARQTHGTRVGWVIDIARETSEEAGLQVADWTIEAMGNGVVALGLGGYEVGNPPEKHAKAFERARAAGLPRVPHAGETEGAASVRGAVETLHADRIGHGVRCLEDPALVALLRERQIPLEVCPTSNVCLGVARSMREHPLPELLDEGLYVTLGSDDPPMFNTSLTAEYMAVACAFGFDAGTLERLVLHGVDAALLPVNERAALRSQFESEFARLRAVHAL